LKGVRELNLLHMSVSVSESQQSEPELPEIHARRVHNLAEPPSMPSFAQIKPVRKTQPGKVKTIKLVAQNKNQFFPMEMNIKPPVADPIAFRYNIKTNHHGKDYLHRFDACEGHPNNCNEKSTIPSSAKNESIRVGKTLRVFQRKRNAKELENLKRPVGERVKLEFDDYLYHNAPKIKKRYRTALLKMFKAKKREVVVPYRNKKRMRYCWNKLQHNERQMFKRFSY
jgi:hypothetical protein